MNSWRLKFGRIAAITAVSTGVMLGFGIPTAGAAIRCAGNTTVAKACTLTGATDTVAGNVTKPVENFYYKLHVRKGERLTVSLIDKESSACLQTAEGYGCGMVLAVIKYRNHRLGNSLSSMPSGDSAGKLDSSTVVAPATGTVYLDLLGIEESYTPDEDSVDWYPVPFVLTVKTS